jgi:muramoyltetrapeptide carboxypeptidase
MTTPPYLSHADKVGIISTAKRIEPKEIEYALTVLKSWGLQPFIGPNAFSADGFLAGTDAQRAADLQQMLDDTSVKAIFFTRGGYGTMRIIDQIDFTTFRKQPKWLVGYSDITLLHNHVQNFGIETLHAVMLQGYESSTHESVESVRAALFGEGVTYKIPVHERNRLVNESVSGTLVGGNLSMIYAAIGSDSGIDTDGKILFIEDIDEYLYHYDRMLVALKRAGKLAKLKALVVGTLIDIKDSTIPFGRDAYQITLEQTANYNYPLYFGFPAGHSSENFALILGREITITQTDSSVQFTFSDKALTSQQNQTV